MTERLIHWRDHWCILYRFSTCNSSRTLLSKCRKRGELFQTLPSYPYKLAVPVLLCLPILGHWNPHLHFLTAARHVWRSRTVWKKNKTQLCHLSAAEALTTRFLFMWSLGKPPPTALKRRFQRWCCSGIFEPSFWNQGLRLKHYNQKISCSLLSIFSPTSSSPKFRQKHYLTTYKILAFSWCPSGLCPGSPGPLEGSSQAKFPLRTLVAQGGNVLDEHAAVGGYISSRLAPIRMHREFRKLKILCL